MNKRRERLRSMKMTATYVESSSSKELPSILFEKENHFAEDLILWICIVILISFGIILNILVIASMLTKKCNGKF